MIKYLANQVPGVQKREVDRLLIMPTGGEVQVKSADNPDSLRGEGLNFVVLDECAFIKEDAWQNALRPALSDRRGGALFISTPKGRNWFWRKWAMAQVSDDSQAWQFPTSDNPYIDPDEIEAARQSLPERVFRQEYLAEFIDDAGGVFRGVLNAATSIQQDTPTPDTQYIVGVDWAKHNDFTVFALIDIVNRSLVYLDRFNQIDYSLQVGRLKALYEKFRPISIVAERNSMGEPLIEQLQQENLPVQPFMTTNASKAQIIDGLALGFERGEIRILPDQTLISELQAYEMERLPSGLLRYSAPDGMHDDMVMALALAWYGATAGVLTGQLFY